MMKAGNSVQFAASLGKMGALLVGRLDEATRNIAFSLGEEVIVGGKYSPGSPVDTGFFRSEWMVSIGTAPSGGLVDRPTKGTFTTNLDKISLILAKVKAGPSIFYSNPASYGMLLELGRSGQAPRGMVRISVAAGQHITDDVVRGMT